MNTKSTRRSMLRLLAAALATGVIGLPAIAQANSLRQGMLFIGTNSPAGNEVLIYAQSEAGAAHFVALVATNGVGTDGGLDSQGDLTLSRNGRYLFVVNATSNTVSTLALRGVGIVLTSVADSGGLTPTSVTKYSRLVYVMNAGGSGNVAGFRNAKGVLARLANGVGGLSSAGGTAPAQVADGSLGTWRSTPPPGLTPFGFAFTRRDQIVVSEANGVAAGGGSASSHRFDWRAPTSPLFVSGAIPTKQTAACWVAGSPDGRFAYTWNAGSSSSSSSFAIARNGAINLLQPLAGQTATNAGALDAVVKPNGQQCHVFAQRSLQMMSFTVGEDGALELLGAVGGLPASSAGLAAN